MKKNKKMAIIAIAAVAISMTGNAQEQGDIAVGTNMVVWWTPSKSHSYAGYSWRDPSYTNTGIGAKCSYNITDQLRLAGEFVYFSEKDFKSMWDCRVHTHYLFPVATKTVVYPSVGIGMIGEKNPDLYRASSKPSTVAFTIGIGADIVLSELSPNLILSGEIRHYAIYFDGRYMDKKYKDNYAKIFNFAIGLAYKFNSHKSKY